MAKRNILANGISRKNSRGALDDKNSAAMRSCDGVHWSPCRTQENVKQNKIKWFDFVEFFQMKRKEVTKTFLMTLN